MEPLLHLKAGTFDLTSLPEDSAPSGHRGLYVVQFHDWTAGFPEVLARHGAEKTDYLPELAFLVRIDPEQATALREEPQVRAVAHYRPEWKLAFTPPLRDSQPIQITTMMGEEAAVAGEIRAMSGTVLDAPTGSGMVAAELPSAGLLRLAAHESIRAIGELAPAELLEKAVYITGVFDPLTSTRLKSLDGAQEIVAVLDSGLDRGSAVNLHPAFATPVASHNQHNAGDWQDFHGHGTHVAGIIGARQPNSPYQGVASAARLVIQKAPFADIRNPQTQGPPGLAERRNITPADVTEYLNRARQEGARIHNNSWGRQVNKPAYDEHAAAMDRFVWAHRDFVIVCAAGNDKSLLEAIPDEICSPALAKNVITVGSSENNRPALMNRDGQQFHHERVSTFSNVMDRDGVRLKPDVVAPGQRIISAKSRTPGAAAALTAAPHDGYVYSDGTSMAAPHVAGVVALIRQYLRLHLQIATPSAALIKALLINGASVLGGQGADKQGWGLIHLENSLGLGKGQYLYPYDESAPLQANTSVSSFVDLSSPTWAKWIRAALVWTDPPAAANTADNHLLINQLQLQVIQHSTGLSFWPAGRTGTSKSITSPGLPVNNVQKVIITQPVPGWYEFRVSARRIAQHPQPFALVILVQY